VSAAQVVPPLLHEDVPVGQVPEQLVFPVVVLNVPAVHWVHPLLPANVEYDPAAHGVQLALPKSEVNEPAGHLLQAPPAEEVQPCEQGLQDELPTPVVCQPALHCVQLVLPGLEAYVFTAQGVQLVAPNAEKVPAGH
jgi:hypothetical protein